MTITEIARKLRVSPSTVSRALNPATPGRIAEPLRKRIRAFAAKTHYVPNRTAQELVRGRSHTIGVILSTVFNSAFFNDYMAKTLAGIYAVLQANGRFGCKLIVLRRGATLQESDEDILGTGVDGLMISSIGDFSAHLFERLAQTLATRWQKPIVGLNMAGPAQRGLSKISFSNSEAVRQGVTHLVQKGRKRIALVWADNGSVDVNERVAAYKTTLREHHLPIKPILMAKGDFLTDGGYRAALTFFDKRSSRPDAIFCINDEMAVGAIRAVKAIGLRCPEDVAVMGFDGLDLGKFIDTRLTTMRQPVREMAEAGTRLMLDLLEERQKTATVIQLSAELVIRDSA